MSQATIYICSSNIFNIFPSKTTWSNELAFHTESMLVQEPVIGLIKWLGSKGLKVCSYVEKCAKLKNQTLKNRLVHKSSMCNGIPPGYAISQDSA